MEDVIHIRLIGGLQVLKGDKAIAAGSVDAQQRVLSYLACKAISKSIAGEPLSVRESSTRSELMRMLWPNGANTGLLMDSELEEHKVGSHTSEGLLQTRLRSMFSAIRKKLEIPGVARDDVLNLKSIGFGPRVLIDVEEELKRLHRLVKPPLSQDRVKQLIVSLSLWKDVLLPEQSDDHFSVFRRAHIENFVRVVGFLADACDVQDDTPRHGKLANHAFLNVEQCMPYNDIALLETTVEDRLHADRMRLALATHKPDKALQIARELQHEVGAALGPEVQKVCQRAREALHSLHIKKQIRHLSSVRCTFIGRGKECEALKGQLLTHPKLLTVTGPPGVGKTRLVEEVAARMQAEFASQVYTVALQTLRHSDQVVSAIIRSLGLDLPAINLLGYLITALSRSPTLLILDNCEHLLEIGSDFTDLVATLIAEVPTLTCLATSRTSIDLPEAIESVLTPLPVPALLPLPDTRSSIAELKNNVCVQLFIEAAQNKQNKKRFNIIAQNARAVRNLCIELDGLPLAIILVASWTSNYLPRELLANIERVKKRTSAVPQEPRHASLDAAISVSLENLSQPITDLFMQLSVFQGGWTVDAACAVCGRHYSIGETMENALQALADRSLADILVGIDHIRYKLLETLRAFGENRLKKHEAQELAAKHARWFTDWAEQTHAKLKGVEQATWLTHMEMDHGNLRKALNWWQEQGEIEEVLRLCAVLQQFWWHRGYLEEGRRQSAAVLLTAGEQAPTKGYAGVLYGAGNLAMMQGDYTQARVYLERCIAVREALQDVRGSGTALNTLGLLARRQGDYHAARERYVRALALMRMCMDREGISACLDNLGVVATDLNEFKAAYQYHEQSLALRRADGNERGIATSLQNVARAAKKQGDYAWARTLLEESLTIRRKLGDRQGIADALNNLGNISQEQHDLALAQQFHEEALSLRRTLGILPGIASSLTNLGSLARLAGNYPEAYRLFQESLALRRELGDRSGIVLTLSNLGHLAYALKDMKAAYAYLHECLQLSVDGSENEYVAWAWEGYAILALADGNIEAAVKLRTAADSLRTRYGVPLSPTQRDWLADNLSKLDEVSDQDALEGWSEKGAKMTVQEVMHLTQSLNPPNPEINS